jgi:Family of unknown function (DUF6353)
MKFVPAAVTRQVGRHALLVSKASPELLLVAGMAGMVGSTVLACRATLKVDKILSESKDKMTLANSLQHDDYSETDRMRDRTLIRYQTAVAIGRQYAPAIGVGLLSLAALTKSNAILTQRATALAAAYTALDQGFRQYRARVIDRYGEEADQELRYGIETKEIEDPETGEKSVQVTVPGDPSIYARFFDETNDSWSRDPEVNLFFLKSQQNYANDLLKANGHIFLNEVYDLIGLDRSKAGQVVGWLWTSNGTTDNFVDFGIFNAESMKARHFVNGYEGAILLDFNVDGVIYDQIEHGMMEVMLPWRRNKQLNR